VSELDEPRRIHKTRHYFSACPYCGVVFDVAVAFGRYPDDQPPPYDGKPADDREFLNDARPLMEGARRGAAHLLRIHLEATCASTVPVKGKGPL
jgi:hypothetical protein